MSASPRPRSSTPSSVAPSKRPFGLEDEQHVPAVSSPLNPDFANARTRKAPAREQREKKESLKKREAKGTDGPRTGTPPDAQSHGKKLKKPAPSQTTLSPIRYKLAAPKSTDFDPPRAPIFTPTHLRAQRQFYEGSEHVYNRKGFRYIHCIADPAFPSSQYHRASETEPYGPRFNFEDASSHILFDIEGKAITTEKGFRMARANVGAREGRWYWECKILSGVRPLNQNQDQQNSELAPPHEGGHVRVGWARREAGLDTPVGFDAYSYGLRDVSGQRVHMSRPTDFAPNNASFCEGDVIGLEINLPSLSLHRKVVEGVYNKAVDVSDDLELSPLTETPDIIRDRVPIRYKAHLYFEQFEYHSVKELEELMNPVPIISSVTGSIATAPPPPSPNHPLVPLRTLPFSSIKVYKNGKLVGTPFTDLLAFLPPASKPLNQVGARDGLDDGMLGYFPAVSVFRGGCAEVNFGPDFWFPPSDLLPAGGCKKTISSPTAAEDEDVDMLLSTEPLAQSSSSSSPPSQSSKTTKNNSTSRKNNNGNNNNIRGDTDNKQKEARPPLHHVEEVQHRPMRALGQRYNEQIAEDVVYDMIDEVDFWAQDGGDSSTVELRLGGKRPVTLDPGGGGAEEAAMVTVGNGVGLRSSRTGEIQELVQEEE